MLETIDQMIEMLEAVKSNNAEWRYGDNGEWCDYTEANRREFNLVGFEFRLKSVLP